MRSVVLAGSVNRGLVSFHHRLFCILEVLLYFGLTSVKKPPLRRKLTAYFFFEQKFHWKINKYCVGILAYANILFCFGLFCFFSVYLSVNINLCIYISNLTGKIWFCFFINNKLNRLLKNYKKTKKKKKKKQQQ